MKLAVLVVMFATSAQCQLWVSSDFGHAVLQFDPQTGVVLPGQPLIAPGSGGLDQPHGIIDRRSGVLVASFGADEVKRYDRNTGAFIDNFIPTTAGLVSPVYLAIGPGDGYLYVSSQGNDRVMRFDLENGAAIDQSPFISGGMLDGPSGFGWSPDGTILYVAGRYSANVLAYAAATGSPLGSGHEFATGLGAGDTFGLVVDRTSGDVFVATGGNVLRFNSAGELSATIDTTGAIGLEDAPDGSAVYVASNNNLYRIAKSDNGLSGPLLSGASINLLNFFHFSKVTDPFLSPLEAYLIQGQSAQPFMEVTFTVSALTSGSTVTLQWSPDLATWNDGAVYTLVGRTLVRDANDETVMLQAPGQAEPSAIDERGSGPVNVGGQRFYRVVAEGK